MLPSEERLRRASVFQRAYNKRMVVSTSIVTMYILPKEGKRSDSWRPLTGFVVAKKVSKSSVKRNRAKRRIREVYRLLRTSVFDGKRDDIALKDWYAIVFVAHEAALEASYEQVEEAVVSCLVRGSSKNRKDRQGGKEPGGFSKPNSNVPSHSRQAEQGKPKSAHSAPGLQSKAPSGSSQPEQARSKSSPDWSGSQSNSPSGSRQTDQAKSKPSQGSSRSQFDGQRRQNDSQTANRRQDKNSFQKPPETKS